MDLFTKSLEGQISKFGCKHIDTCSITPPEFAKSIFLHLWRSWVDYGLKLMLYASSTVARWVVFLDTIFRTEVVNLYLRLEIAALRFRLVVNLYPNES
ncbi:hypothetical protein Hdeb2414_s0008g00265841 [Helianthus debilis subsp. tardiflorus]